MNHQSVDVEQPCWSRPLAVRFT